jgi:hypothetical protein
LMTQVRVSPVAGEGQMAQGTTLGPDARNPRS